MDSHPIHPSGSAPTDLPGLDHAHEDHNVVDSEPKHWKIVGVSMSVEGIDSEMTVYVCYLGIVKRSY